MDCWGFLALLARSLVEHAGWASCLDATTDLKHLADDCSSLGKAIGSHCGDGAARRRWLQIDLHRTGMRSAIVLSIAAHRGQLACTRGAISADRRDAERAIPRAHRGHAAAAPGELGRG